LAHDVSSGESQAWRLRWSPCYCPACAWTAVRV